jgi:hypothetical protein
MSGGTANFTQTHLGVGLNFKPAIAEMTFAAEGVDGSRIICADFLLLGIVPDAHANVVIACSATKL